MNTHPTARVPRVLTLGAAGLRGGVGEYCRTIARSTAGEICWILADDVDDPVAESALAPYASAVFLAAAYRIESLPQAVARCRAAIARERIDLVHAHTLRAGVLAALALRGSKIPLIYTPHSLRLAQEHRWWKYPYFWALEAAVHHRASVVTFLSEHEARSTRRARLPSSRRCEVIPTTLDLAPFLAAGSARANATTLESPTIIMCGALDGRKDPFFFLEVAATILHWSPRAHFVWVGDGPLRAAVLRRIASSGLAGHVELAGAMPRSEIASMMGTADSMLFTSRAEGIPLAVLEAQAAGCVIVSREFSGFEEVVISGTTGLTFPMNRPDLAAQLLRRSLQPDVAGDLRASAMADVRRRRADSESMGKAFHGIIRSLLRESAI